MFRGAKTRQHHELRGLDGTAGQDHCAAGMNRSPRSFSADCLAIFDENFCSLGFRPNFQMPREFGKGVQIGDG